MDVSRKYECWHIDPYNIHGWIHFFSGTLFSPYGTSKHCVYGMKGNVIFSRMVCFYVCLMNARNKETRIFASIWITTATIIDFHIHVHICQLIPQIVCRRREFIFPMKHVGQYRKYHARVFFSLLKYQASDWKKNSCTFWFDEMSVFYTEF